MLEVLRHQDLEGVLATVVRYYGGIQLGAGGLVRAYTDCVAQALKGATIALERKSIIGRFEKHAIKRLLGDKLHHVERLPSDRDG